MHERKFDSLHTLPIMFDGDTQMLLRLLRSKIQVNAADHDKRTVAHIAVAECNVVALKVLVKFGANLTALLGSLEEHH